MQLIHFLINNYIIHFKYQLHKKSGDFLIQISKKYFVIFLLFVDSHFWK